MVAFAEMSPTILITLVTIALILLGGLSQMWPPKTDSGKRMVFELLILLGILNLLFVYWQVLETETAEQQARASQTLLLNNVNSLKVGLAKAQKVIDDVKVATENQKLSEESIWVSLRYAYEFGYLGATYDDGNQDRVVVSSKPIKVKFEAGKYVSFRFAVMNGNNGIPLHNTLLQIVFPKSGLAVEATGPWRPETVNRRYSAPLGTVNNIGVTPNGILSIKFPGPGTYYVVGLIDGSGIRMVERKFAIKVL